MTTLPTYVTDDYLQQLTPRKGIGSGKPGDRCSTQEVRAWLGLDRRRSPSTVPWVRVAPRPTETTP